MRANHGPLYERMATVEAIRLKAISVRPDGPDQEVEFYVNRASYNVEQTWYRARKAMESTFGHRDVSCLKRLDPPGVYVSIMVETPKWAVSR